MRLLALLSLLPILTLSSPVPLAEPEAAAEPYNPFFPPAYPADADVPHVRRFNQEELLDRARLEESGREDQIALARQAGNVYIGKRSEPIVERQVGKRAKVCKPKTTTASAAVPTQTGTTPSSAAPVPQPSPSTVRKSVDPYGDGPFSGYGTWFNVGLSACGTWDSPAMPVVAVSAELFDQWPGYTDWNPNNNPICGKHLDITWGGKTLTVEVTDRCPECSVRSLDLSKGAFKHFADLGVGLFGGDNYTPNITWSWTEGSGRLPQVPV